MISQRLDERDMDVTGVSDTMEVNSSGFYKTEMDVTNMSDHIHMNS